MVFCKGCWEPFKGPENFVRISKSSHYTSSNQAELNITPAVFYVMPLKTEILNIQTCFCYLFHLKCIASNANFYFDLLVLKATDCLSCSIQGLEGSAGTFWSSRETW